MFTPQPLGPFRHCPATSSDLLQLINWGGSPDHLHSPHSTAEKPASNHVAEDLHWADEATLDVVKFLAAASN
jgi:hypothetical protein